MLIKVLRQPILGQQLLGIDNPGAPSIGRIPKNTAYASTLEKNGGIVAVRSAYYPFYESKGGNRSKTEFQTFYANEWLDVTDSTWKEFPATPTADNGSGATECSIRFNRPEAYPPYISGKVRVSGIITNSTFSGTYVSLLATNGAHEFIPDTGYFDVTIDIDGQDLANVNIPGTYPTINGAITIPLVDGNMITRLDYTLQSEGV